MIGAGPVRWALLITPSGPGFWSNGGYEDRGRGRLLEQL